MKRYREIAPYALIVSLLFASFSAIYLAHAQANDGFVLDMKNTANCETSKNIATSAPTGLITIEGRMNFVTNTYSLTGGFRQYFSLMAFSTMQFIFESGANSPNTADIRVGISNGAGQSYAMDYAWNVVTAGYHIWKAVWDTTPGDSLGTIKIYLDGSQIGSTGTGFETGTPVAPGQSDALFKSNAPANDIIYVDYTKISGTGGGSFLENWATLSGYTTSGTCVSGYPKILADNAALTSITASPSPFGATTHQPLVAPATILSQSKTTLQTDSYALGGVPTAAGAEAAAQNTMVIYTAQASTWGLYIYNISLWVKFVGTATSCSCSGANVAVGVYSESTGAAISAGNPALLKTSYALFLANKTTNFHLTYAPNINLAPNVNFVLTAQTDHSGVYIYNATVSPGQLYKDTSDGALVVSVNSISTPNKVTTYSTQAGDPSLGLLAVYQSASTTTSTITTTVSGTISSTTTISTTQTVISFSTSSVTQTVVSTQLINAPNMSATSFWEFPMLFIMLGGGLFLAIAVIARRIGD